MVEIDSGTSVLLPPSRIKNACSSPFIVSLAFILSTEARLVETDLLPNTENPVIVNAMVVE